MTRYVVVTGTDTGVGKTVVTAALAACAARLGKRVLVVKPLQTGIGGADPDRGDIATVAGLSGCAGVEFVALDEPLAPDTAARLQGVALPPVGEHVARILELGRDHDVVIVEGAGGLLVRLDRDGGTLLELARDLRFRLGDHRRSPGETLALATVIVTRAGLGTLNHTELTVTAMRAAQLEPAGLVIGSWPEDPGLAERCNREDLERLTGVPVVGVLPQGAGQLDPDAFRDRATQWFSAAQELLGAP
jgi:dethiobiotin synthetase